MYETESERASERERERERKSVRAHAHVFALGPRLSACTHSCGYMGHVSHMNESCYI